ncbi:glycosyltransferase [Patescibacteria group bacterium]|nr:glycosyltransferase [Patescibacteria group bacterium]
MNNTKKASKTTPQLSIVFPNWNGVQAALEYLGSIQNSSYSREKIEVILVDNHSEDDSVSQVRKKFPEVKIIELDKNYGPAYARNRGLEKACGKYIFCSDNDQVLATNTLQILANRLQINSDIGIVGAKVLSKTKPHQIVSCGYTFNRWLGAESGRKDCKEIKECDWIAGCCMMFRKASCLPAQRLGGVGYHPE